jgi:CHAT domain-containing protein
MLLTGPASPDSLRSAPWLLRQYSIVHTPSVQSLASLRGRAPTSTAARPFIGFGDFRPPSRAQLVRSFPAGLGRCGRDAEIAAGLGSLPNSSREIQLAAETMGRNSVIRLGANFTRDAVLGTNLREFRVIHFATHGLLPGDLSCLLEPAIMVSNPPGAADATGSFLTSSAIMRLRLDADLVVLSACNTAGPGVAGGSEQSAEALSGLASAFFFAGARGLLTTHWSVNDLAATAIMARMLAIQEGADTAARSGTSSARALQAAQIALLDVSGGALAHPYYWAPFALIGDGRRDLGTQAKIGPRESVASR